MIASLIKRWRYADDYTRGRWEIEGETFHTLGRPWLKAVSHPGGEAFVSCIPDGLYDLVPYTRQDGTRTYAFVNHDLGVYLTAAERPEIGGRYKNLFHVGNRVEDSAGCELVGMDYSTTLEGLAWIRQSRKAFTRIMELLGYKVGHTCEIVNMAGAVD